MNSKKAKKMRKELRRELVEELTTPDNVGVPVAGCPRCGCQLFYLVLDNYPPKHEVIESFICYNPMCRQGIQVGLNIAEHTRMEIEEETEVE